MDRTHVLMREFFARRHVDLARVESALCRACRRV
jgi:hypothetical protein